MSEDKDLRETSSPESSSSEEETPKFRGLYRYVHVSVRTLDIIIVCCILVIIVVTALSLSDRGFVVSFDSKGGSDVEAQKYQYGELLVPPEPPQRQGYEFAGWFKDPACDLPWNMEEDTVQQAITLYAAWEKLS